ncbi:glycosyltransferase family 2 protein [Seonamhaeicola maritimus]|uniref:glycosyltransferase family 2 protein n=1 Tax=Seonamhaeicola maritimus TaxID=2591822 RepID=UPI0024950375|nr:glycosyltransferase family 2 protein [Seonamhaeicola maritimus]
MSNHKISVAIITYNEERILAKCLEKLNWVDEIIAVDSGSTDKTLEICNRFNVKVFHRDFDGFGFQKQFAVDQTSNDWVLSLDSDEILSDTLITEIQKSITINNLYKGFYIRRKHVFLGKTFNFGRESKQLILRLFNKEHGGFNDSLVHEKIVVNGKTSKLKHHFLHYSYESISSYLEKLNKYTSLYAKEKSTNNRSFNIFIILIKSKFEFIRRYIFEGNFLNGIAGFHWSWLSAFYSYIKYIKTNDLIRNKN